MSDMYVEVAAFHGGGRLRGFVVSGRWPVSTREWAQFLALAVRLAAVPGLLATTTVFRAVDDVPDDPQPGTVGLVTSEGPVLGDGAPAPGQFAGAAPPALLLLHPPTESRPSTPEVVGAASGCVLLPGLPHLGLEHRAAWVEAEVDGTVTRLVSRVGVDPAQDPDTAVLAMLLAA
ncbi:MAG: peptidase [Actinomycetales bacterium]|nr:peptidase [Actinomycetales bacterium]